MQGSDTVRFSGKKLVRMCWEKPYLEALIDHLRPSGNVLEVGFALGYSSARIQTFHPKHHTIIESDPKIASQARAWAAAHENISVISGRWADLLPSLPTFDTIFFNDCHSSTFPLDRAAEKSAHHLVQQGKDLIATIHNTFPHITGLRYSADDLDTFFANLDNGADPSQISRFLYELMQNGQISEAQLDRVTAKHQLQKYVAKPHLNQDPMLVFLKACLQHHMHKGSRFSCFSSNPLSKFEYPEFFDSIITNPAYDYTETLMSVEVPEGCSYYPYKEALIITLEKQQ
ncbi:MAG: class I SAM-dependent methyltransferase [Chlamydiae bacterium]|nr:class I SAM-dependent methyltransferase [Chlamydiota bacterium]